MEELSIRQRLEQTEHENLAPWAAFADASRGRAYPEAPCQMRTCYQRDVDRIAYSKAFRRLMHKTQVFLQPEGDHYRTRMTHTLEVSRIARSIARGLQLNEDLTEAAALGHDLGHTPFGHAGEVALTEVLGRPFRHNEQSLRVVDRLENDGRGLNLCYEVRMGIVGHTGPEIAQTLEGQIVRIADRIAYINHDIDDAMRAGILTNDDIPASISDILGHTHRQRIDTLVRDMIACSMGGDRLQMHVSTARIAALVRHLESKGLVLRAREPKDERKIRISLTPAGRALLQARAAQAAACAQQLLAALEPDELQQYLALQRKLLGAATEIAPSQTV